ncbi:MAG: winged helix-turn-helix domain-containing protein [Candidatus Aenigmatarchaeota archaeon]
MNQIPDEKLARAIRSKMRRDMLHLLVKKKQMPVHEIAARLKISESLASRHLKMLYDFGLVDFKFEAPEKFYFIKIGTLGRMLEAYQAVVKEMKK